MEKRLTFGQSYGFKAMTADELIAELTETGKAFGIRWCFFFDGKPYTMAKEVDLRDVDSEAGVVVLFKAQTNSMVENFIYRFWQGEEKKASKCRKEDIAGYEIVDVYENGRFVGSYKNVVVK